MQRAAPPPPSHRSLTLLDNVQPDFLWRLVNRNGSSAKLCTVGISTFLLSHKITACCSILCYGRCMPMGWLVEQRMGESRPACSSKQVLGAFEDAHLLQAKVGLWRSNVLTVVCAHSQTQHSKMITETFDQFDPPACCLVTRTGKRERLCASSRWRLWDHCLAKIFDPLYIVCVYSWYNQNNKYCISRGTYISVSQTSS